MRKGSTYDIGIKIKDAETKQPIDNRAVKRIRFTFGDVDKYYPDEVVYDEENQKYLIKLEQQDTMKFRNMFEWQVKILFASDDVAQSEIKSETTDNTLSGVIENGIRM